MIIYYAGQTPTIMLSPNKYPNVRVGESISYNCRCEGSIMQLYSPPIVPESSALTLFSTDPVQRCIVLPSKASACVLVDSPGNSSFTGTLTLFISEEVGDQEDFLVHCRVFTTHGVENTSATYYVDTCKPI